MPTEARWNVDLFVKMVGTPATPKPIAESDETRPFVPRILVPDVDVARSEHKLHLRAGREFEKYGLGGNCYGRRPIRSNIRRQAHSDGCLARIIKRMRDDGGDLAMGMGASQDG